MATPDNFEECSPSASSFTAAHHDVAAGGEAALPQEEESGGKDDEEDEFGDFGAAESAPQPSGPPTSGPAASQLEELDDDDEFGDFGAADDPPCTSGPAVLPQSSEQAQQEAPAASGSGSTVTAEQPDLLRMPDDELLAAVASAWAHGDVPPAAAALPAERALEHLRGLRLAPQAAPPGSILALGGIPMASRTAKQGIVSAAASSSGTKMPLVLGQVYTPVVRCNALQQWQGSASEQRLLVSLGLADIAQQAREWEEAEAAAGARYDRRGNLFGGVGSSMTPAGSAASLSGLSRASSHRSHRGPSYMGKEGGSGSLSGNQSVSGLTGGSPGVETPAV